MKEQSVTSKSTKLALEEILMIVSVFLLFAGLAVQKADLSNPLVGKIFYILGGVLFLVSFIWILVKDTMKES